MFMHSGKYQHTAAAAADRACRSASVSGPEGLQGRGMGRARVSNMLQKTDIGPLLPYLVACL